MPKYLLGLLPRPFHRVTLLVRPTRRTSANTASQKPPHRTDIQANVQQPTIRPIVPLTFQLFQVTEVKKKLTPTTINFRINNQGSAFADFLFYSICVNS